MQDFVDAFPNVTYGETDSEAVGWVWSPAVWGQMDDYADSFSFSVEKSSKIIFILLFLYLSIYLSIYPRLYLELSYLSPMNTNRIPIGVCVCVCVAYLSPMMNTNRIPLGVCVCVRLLRSRGTPGVAEHHGLGLIYAW